MDYYKQWAWPFSERKSKADSSTATITTPPPNEIWRTDIFSSWKERFRRVSNIASILCVLDCTLLPICTFLLPLLGMGFSVERAKWIHKLGHSVALFFVLPVGTLTTVLNYSTHRRTQILFIACLGLFLIYTANANYDNHSEYLPLQHLHPNEKQHDNHHHRHHWSHDAMHLNYGTFHHRIFNILGCTLLMGSNYLSRQFLKEHPCQGPCYCSSQEPLPLTTQKLNREMYNSYHYMQRIRNRGTGSVLPLLVAPSRQHEESSSLSDIVQLPADYYCQPISAK